MPWVEGLGAEDTRTLARECLRSRYGEAAQTWEICLPPGSRGVPRIVAGAPMELLNALRAGGAQRQFRVSAVQPALSVMSRRGSLGSGIATGWLVQSEPGRVCLARFSGDAWQGVTSTRTGADPENELASLVEVEAVANGMSRNTAVILIEAAGDSAAAALVARGWTVRSLPSNAGRGVQ
jgi:hypothetical protein